MPEDGQGQWKHVAYSGGFNIFVVFDRNKYINSDLLIK
jgi:hypothetical protein